MKKLAALSCLVLAVVAAPAALAARPAYTITDLGTLGGLQSVAYSLDDHGVAVGRAERADGRSAGARFAGGGATELPLTPLAIDANGDVAGEAYFGIFGHAALLTSAGLRDLGTLPGAVSSTAYDVNDQGQVVGRSGDRAFVWANGTMQDLGAGEAFAVNDRGQAVGQSGRHAALWENGVRRDLGTLGGAQSSAHGINDRGDVVGSAQVPGDVSRPFVYRDGVMTEIPMSPGYQQGVAWAIDERGDVVGHQDSFSSPGRAFVHVDGVTYDPNDLIPPGSGWILTEAMDINERGQIVGYGFLHDRQRAYLLTPVAAPTVTPTVTGTLGANGWYVSDVSVAWTVSGATSQTGCDPVSVTTDTIGVSLSCTAANAGGTTVQTVTVKRDATAPVVAYSGNAGTYTVDRTVSIGCSASDPAPGSGVASSTCADASGPAYALGLGAHALAATATDAAGNVGGGSTTFSVTVTPASLCSLTVRFVRASDGYAALPDARRKPVDRLASTACGHLDRLAALPVAPRRALVLAYELGVEALARGGWLTRGQETTLVQLARAL